MFSALKYNYMQINPSIQSRKHCMEEGYLYIQECGVFQVQMNASVQLVYKHTF